MECNAARARFEHGVVTDNVNATANSASDLDPFICFRQREYNGLVCNIKLDSGIYPQVPSAWASIIKMPSVYLMSNKSDILGESHQGLNPDTRFGVGLIYDNERASNHEAHFARLPNNDAECPQDHMITGDFRAERGRGRGRARGGCRHYQDRNITHPTTFGDQNRTLKPRNESGDHYSTAKNVSRGQGYNTRSRGRGRGGRRNISNRSGHASFQVHVDLEEYVPEVSFRASKNALNPDRDQVENEKAPHNSNYYIDQSYEALMAENERLVNAPALGSSHYIADHYDTDPVASQLPYATTLYSRVNLWRNDGGEMMPAGSHYGYLANEQDRGKFPESRFPGNHDYTFKQGYEDDRMYDSQASTTAVDPTHQFIPPQNATEEEVDRLYARFLDEMNESYGVEDIDGLVGLPHNMDTYEAMQLNRNHVDILQAATARRRAQMAANMGSPVARHRSRPAIGGTVRDRRFNRNRLNLGESLTRPTTPLVVNTAVHEPPRSRSANFLRPRGGADFR